MAGTIYSKFFWQDWHGENLLAMCSMGAQGFWMRLLVIAAQSSTPGHVLLDGHKPSTAELLDATRCRRDITAEMVEGWINELVERGVCDLTREGIIVSRRIVRDERKRRSKSSGGKVSSQLSPRDEKGNFTSRSSLHRHAAPATINQSPESINQSPSTIASKPADLEQNLSKVARAGKALGINFTTTRNGHRFIEQLIQLQQDGFDFELDILPTFEDARAEGRVPDDLTSLRYFRKPIEAKKAARLIAAEAAKQAAEAPHPATKLTREEWMKILDNSWAEKGVWITGAWGPSPRLEGFLGPKDLQEIAVKWWNANGHRPRREIDEFDFSYKHLDRDPEALPWDSNVVPIKATG